MAPPQGLLPASTDVVLEIQLKKLINDFLFAGVGDAKSSSMCQADTEGQKNASSCIVEDRSTWIADAKPREMENPLGLSLKNAHLSENASSSGSAISVKEASNLVPGFGNDQSPGTRLSDMVEGCSSLLPDHNGNNFPTTEEVRLDIHEQTSNLCNGNPQHGNKVKVYRLSKSHSVGGSVFRFSLKRQGENKEKEGKGSIKLTRIGSLPCHSKLCNDAEKGFKHTCKKPPRPPRSPLEKNSDNGLSRHETSDAILVLHGTSRRARFERRRRHSGPASSNASIWALIFTLFFALAMLGEGFWSQKSALIARNPGTGSSFDIIEANNDMKMNSRISFIDRTAEGSQHVSSQLEKEMQMREFWISKGLDPT
ncbi:hypothetical protein GOP47_0009316 [Adiantum capillus-veneris]|uniref:Uncharacterized protein n=1 Tax=Adiantum capillus-veneris TaxID=13818 RepID=A0A9D4UVZ7_ADICA|nr:hypothetical protein GOP47_0009316 [Adiantum capillus-veneris]